MAAVTISSDFWSPRKQNLPLFPLFVNLHKLGMCPLIHLDSSSLSLGKFLHMRVLSNKDAPNIGGGPSTGVWHSLSAALSSPALHHVNSSSFGSLHSQLSESSRFFLGSLSLSPRPPSHPHPAPVWKQSRRLAGAITELISLFLIS